MPLRVIRVGGSLLTWDSFVSVFERWLGSQPPAFNVLTAGGGPWVELLRQSARRFELPESEAHVLCLRALSVTTDLVGQLCRCPVVLQLNDVQRAVAHQQMRVAFDVYQHLEEVDALRSDSLPKTWAVTSDSIAARIAEDLRADELVLLKSADCPEVSGGFAELGGLGFVDSYFATAARGLEVRFVNLRACE